MPSVREVSSASFGAIKIATTNEKEILYCLQDLCKLFSINLQNARMEIGNKEILEIPLKKHEKKKLFIKEKDLDVCLRLSQDEKADLIYEWLKEIKLRGFTIFYDYTVNDLKNEEIAFEFLNRLNELEKQVSVQSVKIEEDMPKVELVDKLFGANAPIDISLVPQRIKYRGLSLFSILEDLRISGIFNDSNMPYQKYIDNGHFRLVTTISNVKAEEIVVTKVLVYRKGIKLIEEIIKKKAGKNDRRERKTNSLYSR